MHRKDVFRVAVSAGVVILSVSVVYVMGGVFPAPDTYHNYGETGGHRHQVPQINPHIIIVPPQRSPQRPKYQDICSCSPETEHAA